MQEAGAPTRPLIPAMRLGQLAIAGVVFLLGLSLFVLTGDTDRYFAWTIAVPLTAAFLGSSYWAGLVLLILSARERHWARARVVVPVAFTLGIMLTLATLLHLDLFHFDSVTGWVWLVTYLSLAPGLSLVLMLQLRAPGGDPPRVAPLEGGARLVLGAQTAVLLGLGLALFVLPSDAPELWPWPLTPLTSQAVGSMLLGHGVAVAAVLRENDWARVKAPMISYTALGVLQLTALARYGDTLDWGSVEAWVYLLFLVAVLVTGAYGWLAATRAGAIGLAAASAAPRRARS